MAVPISPDTASWDRFVRQQPDGHLLQLSAWGALKEAYGWHSERIALLEDDRIRAGAQVLFRPLPLRLGSMAYLPFGAYVTHEGQWLALWDAVRQVCRRHRAALLKVEPGFRDISSQQLEGWGFRPSSQTIQPPRTILIDIADDEAMLARMNQGTRRKIRQSLKSGVRCYEAAPADVGRFTALMQATGTRGAFGVHEASYYETAYQLFVPQEAALILAEHEGDTLAAVFVFALGDTAWYFYGASSDAKRNLMASYAAQWAAIQWARARGCRVYDMWGIPDEDEAALEAQFEQRSDGLWGVYGFKRGWGGRVARTPGAWDMPLNPILYTAYQWMLKWRNR